MRLPGRTVPVLSLAHVSPVLRAQFLSPFSLFLLIFSYLPYSTPALLFRTHFTTLAPVVQVDKKQNEIFAFRKNSVIMAVIRGVAQPGRVLGLGPRCRRFEPSHPDQKFKKSHFIATFFMCRPQSAGLCGSTSTVWVCAWTTCTCCAIATASYIFIRPGTSEK